MKRGGWLGIFVLGAVEFAVLLSAILWIYSRSPAGSPLTVDEIGTLTVPPATVRMGEVVTPGYDGLFYKPVPGDSGFEHEGLVLPGRGDTNHDFEEWLRQKEGGEQESPLEYFIIDPGDPKGFQQEGDWNKGEPYAGQDRHEDGGI